MICVLTAVEGFIHFKRRLCLWLVFGRREIAGICGCPDGDDLAFFFLFGAPCSLFFLIPAPACLHAAGHCGLLVAAERCNAFVAHDEGGDVTLHTGFFRTPPNTTTITVVRFATRTHTHALLPVGLFLSSLSLCLRSQQAEGGATKVATKKVDIPGLTEKKKTTRYRDGKVVTTTGAKARREDTEERKEPKTNKKLTLSPASWHNLYIFRLQRKSSVAALACRREGNHRRGSMQDVLHVINICDVCTKLLPAERAPRHTYHNLPEKHFFTDARFLASCETPTRGGCSHACDSLSFFGGGGSKHAVANERLSDPCGTIASLRVFRKRFLPSSLRGN